MNESKSLDLEAIRLSFVENDCIDARVVALCDEVERLRARVKELEETLEHGCFRCGYVGSIPEQTKGDQP